MRANRWLSNCITSTSNPVCVWLCVLFTVKQVRMIFSFKLWWYQLRWGGIRLQTQAVLGSCFRSEWFQSLPQLLSDEGHDGRQQGQWQRHTVEEHTECHELWRVTGHSVTFLSHQRLHILLKQTQTKRYVYICISIHSSMNKNQKKLDVSPAFLCILWIILSLLLWGWADKSPSKVYWRYHVKVSSHQIDITQAVDPEGVQGRADHVQLIGLKGLLTLHHCAVQPGADPLVHPAHRARLNSDSVGREIREWSDVAHTTTVFKVGALERPIKSQKNIKEKLHSQTIIFVHGLCENCWLFSFYFPLLSTSSQFRKIKCLTCSKKAWIHILKHLLLPEASVFFP